MSFPYKGATAIQQLILWLIAILLLIPLASSCGKKSNPIVPRAIGPQSIKKFQAIPRSGGIILTWKPPTKNMDKTPLLDLESFKLYREEVQIQDRCAKCPKNFKLLFELAYKGLRGKVPEKNQFVYTDTAVTPGHVYTYKIQCTNERGMLGEASSLVTVFWDVPPAPPLSLRGEIKEKSVLLNWKVPKFFENGSSVEGTVSYNIYRSLEKGVYESAPLNEAPIAENSYEDVPDTYDKTYYYTVRAVRKVADSFVESAPSEQYALLYAKTTPPTPPRGLTAIPSKEGMILKWQAKAEKGIAGFYVYRKDSDGRDYIRLNRELIEENSWLDKTAHIGKRYIYAVTAVDDSLSKNESPLSEPAAIVHLP